MTMPEAPAATDVSTIQPARRRLSIVIPTHNRRDLTLKAVSSVLDQDDAHAIEVIVVDDGSTDDTAIALNLRFGNDRRFRMISITRSFASAARNAGFRAAHGELVCFLDSDDCWTAHTLATIEQVFARHPELTFLSVEGSTFPSPNHPTVARVVAGDAPGWSHAGFGRTLLLTESISLDRAQQQAMLLHGDFFPAIINGDLFSLSGLVMRRDSVEQAGPFAEQFRYYNDWEFFARLCLQGAGAYLDYEGFRRDAGRPDQISRNRPRITMPRRRLFILRSLPRHFPVRASAYAVQLRGALDDAQYWMGRCLINTPHRRFARCYLLRCMRRRYKFGRSLILLMALALVPQLLAAQLERPRTAVAPQLS